MNKIHTLLISTLALAYSVAMGYPSCKKCEIGRVRIIHDNIENLTFNMIRDFLCTFDHSCETNIEFSQWSNEMLYKLLDKESELVIKVIDNIQFNNLELLLKEIENPIQDFDYQGIYTKVSNVETQNSFKQKVLKAIALAADKEGIKIKN